MNASFSIINLRKIPATMYAKLALVAVAAITSGCASVSTSVADKSTLAGLRGQSIGFKVAEPSSFLLSTPENNKMMGRVIVMINQGKDLVVNNGVSDPAQSIAGGIAQRLAAAYGSKTVATGQPANLSIDVKTTNWGIFFSGDDNDVYGLVYTATFELVDVQKGRVVASGYCKPSNKGEILKASRDQMMANSAAGLKRALSGEAERCVKYISEQILSM